MSLLTDCRYALRRLAQSPGYSLAVVAMLALGIAVSSTLFAVLNGVLGSLPYPKGEDLVLVQSDSPERGVREGGLTPAEALRLEQPDAPFADFAFFSWGGLTVFNETQPREFTIALVSQGFFPTLALPPQLGSWFGDADHAEGSDSIILSHAEWQRLFAGRSDAIGSVVDTSDGRMRVVAVMPPAFDYPSNSVGAWRPIAKNRFPADRPFVWNARFLDAIARLDPAIDAGQQRARLNAISRELADKYALTGGRWGLGSQSMLESMVGDLRGLLWGALGVALLVLLIACANVAILVDARQEVQRHHQAVLQALGASATRLFRGPLIEVGMLAFVAVLLGALLSSLSIELLRDLARDSLPRADAVFVSPSLWLFALALGLLVPLTVAATGVLRLRGDAMEAIRGARALVANVRRRPWLPVLGVALSTASVIAGSALLVSLWRLQLVEPGWRHDGVYALQLYRQGEPEALRSFVEQMRARLQAVPGVEQVAVASAAPLSRIGNFSADVKLPTRAQPEPFQLRIRRASADYQDLLDIPLIAGRRLSAEDRAGGEAVTVVNAVLARQLFGDASGLDQIIELPLGGAQRVAHRIVGVIGDTHNSGLRVAPGPELLIPYDGSPTPSMTFLVSARTPLPNYAKLLADALYATDPRQASARTFTLSAEFDEELASARFFAKTVGTAALIGLLLAGLGVYAVAQLRQQQRIGELGLRLALGAQPRTLALSSLRDSARTVALGALAGLLGAWAVLRLLRAQLFGIEGSELQVVLIGIGVLLIATLLAALGPALRAARIDPMHALRKS